MDAAPRSTDPVENAPPDGARPEPDERLPVTLLAGFLGSGKTTLLNRILEHSPVPVAVVVNELGDVGIDGRLVVGAEDRIVELANGCICCTVREDLRETLADLLHRRRRRLFRRARFERVLIEASGLASPGPAVQTLLADPELAAHLRLGGVVTLAHAAAIERQLAEHPEAGEQVAYADHLVLNHVDRCDADALQFAETALRRCNPEAPITRAERAAVDVGEVLALAADRVRGLDRPADAATPPHTCGVGAVTLESDAPLDLHRLKLWLAFVAERRGGELMRAKGIVRCADHEAAVVVQGVQRWLELGPGTMRAPERSTLVLIGRDLDQAELERGWRACGASGPE